MQVAVLLTGSFVAALISGSAGFSGLLLILPVVTVCIVGLALIIPGLHAESCQ